jgi:hypothetical protein
MIALKDLILKAKGSNEWDFSNSILYNLCRDSPKHNSSEIILAKIWIIGRCYAAAIERRKSNKDDINDDFYNSRVVPKIMNSNIDRWIEKCNCTKEKEDALIAHKNLTNLFFELTNLNKRSLASKYLHFHIPDLFYIYDSRVVNSIGKLNTLLKIKNKRKKKNIEVDNDYKMFYEKCERIVEKINQEYGIKLACRELDNLLIELANERLR